jgi:transposase
MDTRQLKALEIAARMRIEFKEGQWLVPSSSGNGVYRVVLKHDGHTCTCPDFELTGKECKHIYASIFVRERDYAGQKLLIDTDTLPAKKTYKQDWASYNQAQTTEKNRLQVLLFDLCRELKTPPSKNNRGRHPKPLADVVFAAVFKVYVGFSARRFNCDLQDAHDKGFLSEPVHCHAVSHYLERPDLTPILHALIARSALPLKTVETEFAVDSSGFSSSKFVRWFDEKYGTTRSGHVWIKAHLACGVKTNIVTACRILEQDSADCPQFGPLMKTTAENFTINEASGDKAYLSNANLELIEALGGTAFVPFKVNSGEGEGVWQRMFHYFQFRREEFLAHYHKRSNVESTFSAVKRKFGDSVRSRTDTAMVNEVLAKVLCHNLSCVIMEQCTLGIEAVFWPEAEKQQTDILPMVR